MKTFLIEDFFLLLPALMVYSVSKKYYVYLSCPLLPRPWTHLLFSTLDTSVKATT
jgi:hypothetical protein